jgi:hypothetical protein
VTTGTDRAETTDVDGAPATGASSISAAGRQSSGEGMLDSVGTVIQIDVDRTPGS